MSLDVLVFPRRRLVSAGGRGRSVPRLQAMCVPRVEHDLDVQRQIRDIVRGLQGCTPPGPAQMRNCQDLWIGRCLFRRRRSDRIILDRPLTTGDNRLRQADGELSDLVRRHRLIQLRRIDRRGSSARR
jgi:hypothetical protein